MNFWDIFIACLTGGGAMLAALAVLGVIATVVIFALGSLANFIGDRL